MPRAELRELPRAKPRPAMPGAEPAPASPEDRPQPLRKKRSPARVRPGRIGPRDLHRAQTDQPRIPAARTAPEDQINVVFFQFYPLKDDRSNLGRGRAGQTEPDGRNDLTGGTRAGPGRAGRETGGRGSGGTGRGGTASAGRARRHGQGRARDGEPQARVRGEGGRRASRAGLGASAQGARGEPGRPGRREIRAAGTDSGAAATFRQSVAGGPQKAATAPYSVWPGPGLARRGRARR
jgi:hypothetical protein